MNNCLRFRTSSSVKDLFGRGLVTDQITAVFELVKNSYDADATEVEIIFEGLETNAPSLSINDNGTGMSLHDIENKWMIIGTDSKKKDLYSPIFKRPLNGDKGIGRFSVDRLGKHLYMESVKKGEDILTSANFNWVAFEGESQDIDSIDIPYEQKRINSPQQGVKLLMTGLRDIWIKNTIDNLFKNLRQFKSPLALEDNFKVYVTAVEYGYNRREVTVEKLEGVSSLWIEAEIKKENPEIIYTTVTRDGLEYEEVVENPYSFGSIKAQVYFFNTGDKIRFKNRYGIRVREYGNIRLFRDNFRIYPYGEENNDWLDINFRMAQGFSRFFGSRDLIGYVQTSKADNKGLNPLTSRQGLEENEDFNQLRHFIINICIKELEKYFFVKFKKNVNETIVKSKQEMNYAVEELDKIAREIKSENSEVSKQIKEYTTTIKKEQKKQLTYVKEQQELVKVYSRIATKETILHKVIHESMIYVHNAKTQVENIIRDYFSEIPKEGRNSINIADKYLDEAKSLLLTVRDDIVKKREKSMCDLSKLISGYISDKKGEFDKNNIELETNIHDNIMYSVDAGDIKTIIGNLVSNSVKSLKKISDRSRKIKAELYKTNTSIIFKLTDNGVGIEESIREKIFDPFQSYTEGFGLGLTIIDETIKEYTGGTFELMDIKEPGACFCVKWRI